MSENNQRGSPVETPVASSASQDAPANNDELPVVSATDSSAKTSGDGTSKNPETVKEDAAKKDEKIKAKIDADTEQATDDDAESITDAGAGPTGKAGKGRSPGSIRGLKETAANYLWVVPFELRY
jgi:hypothetical protein